MNIIRLISPILGALLFASVASAQSYYPPVTTATPSISNAGCVVISSNLSFGSRGSEVSELQRFLVAQNYPGGGNWMVTGYFGAATVTGVRNFQITAGLPTTGYLDQTTRAAIQSRTCGGTLPPMVTPPNFQTTPTYLPPAPLPAPISPVSSYPYSIGNPPTIGSLSVYTGLSGTVVTVYGSNFDPLNNSVRFGPSSTIAQSQSGTQLTFVVPAVSPGSHQVSVSNSRGVSNSMTFSVTGGATVPGCTPGFGNTCCSQWSHNQECGPFTIVQIVPDSGAVSSSATIHGIGFTPSNNSVHFGQGVIANLSSHDGRSVSFTVPSVLSGYGSAQVQISDYPVFVTNAFGENSNVIPFHVNAIAGNPNVAPTIASITGPTSISVGTSGTWTLTLNASIGTSVTTSVKWGDENLYGANTPATTLLQSEQSIMLTHTYQSAGIYTITFTVTTGGGSNTATATVSVGGTSAGSLSLTSLNPISGHPGTVITLQGSGFASGDNIVHFGVGGLRNVYSTGSTIQYTIPAYVSPCDLIQPGFVCGSPVQTVTPGVYPIYITNNAGATNILYFTVTQ